MVLDTETEHALLGLLTGREFPLPVIQAFAQKLVERQVLRNHMNAQAAQARPKGTP